MNNEEKIFKPTVDHYDLGSIVFAVLIVGILFSAFLLN